MAGFIEWDQAPPSAFTDQLYEASVVRDIVPGKLLKFAAAQARMGQKADYIPFFWFADSEDILVFLLTEYPHFWRVLIEHLELQTGIRHIVMFGHVSAEAFQSCQVCIGRPICPALYYVIDVYLDVFKCELVNV